LKIEALCPLHIRRATGDLHLLPGFPIDLPDEEAQRVLAKARGKVRVVPQGAALMEPAVKPDGSPLSAIYWEHSTGEILGPAIPEFFAQDGDRFWIFTTFEGSIWFINADRLRSQKAFLEQRIPREVELAREW
jgi:hypothetical protein